MTRKELKTGMVVKFRNGLEGVVFKNMNVGSYDNYSGIVLTTKSKNFKHDSISLKNFNIDLTFKSNNDKCSQWDIMQVFQLSNPQYTIHPSHSAGNRKLIWDRPRQYTYGQMKKIIGSNFEITDVPRGYKINRLHWIIDRLLILAMCFGFTAAIMFILVYFC